MHVNEEFEIFTKIITDRYAHDKFPSQKIPNAPKINCHWPSKSETYMNRKMR